MTKQEFLNGKSFRPKSSSKIGDCSYKYVVGKDTQKGHIEKEIRHSKTNKVILSDFHITVTKITDNTFSGFNFVMEKEVRVRYSFEELVVVD